MIEQHRHGRWNFHTRKMAVGCSKAEMQFPHPYFLKGWKFIFAHPTGVEIKCGRPVELSGNNRWKGPAFNPQQIVGERTEIPTHYAPETAGEMEGGG